MNRLHYFNLEGRAKVEGKEYKFGTFLKHISGEAVTVTFAQKRGVSSAVEERIHKVFKAINDIAMEKEIKHSEVTPEMIIEKLSFPCTKQNVLALMSFSSQMETVEVISEEHDTFEGKSDVETDMEKFLYCIRLLVFQMN